MAVRPSAHPPRRRAVEHVARALVLVSAVVWCGAVLRILTHPGHTGFVEGLLAAGGWSLSLLPVHCTPRSRRGGERED
ncbi:hypothetical protein GCM10010218_00140 [Streptomyces mashuensis]|uniref:Uncharacterized protein n=1 Tax=Streptomyces mashuensis TaxID=33904 RepID=A0A919AUE7_9ACTN|nr:hypothetical protein [Streptomyces mashuensis]GHF23695.1 hypothetical protein GCM10010218_00140 [Streptomyces mashuensis]